MREVPVVNDQGEPRGHRALRLRDYLPAGIKGQSIVCGPVIAYTIRGGRLTPERMPWLHIRLTWIGWRTLAGWRQIIDGLIVHSDDNNQ